jgi:hypothetical protein
MTNTESAGGADRFGPYKAFNPRTSVFSSAGHSYK